MKTWRYVIESDRRGKIRETSKKYKTIKVEKAYKITENSEEITGFENIFVSGLFSVLLGISLFAITGLFITFVIGSDFILMSYNFSVYFSNVLAVSSILLTLMSFDSIQDIIDNHLKFKKNQNRMIVYIFIAFLSLVFAGILYVSGVSLRISNLISLCCLYLTILTNRY